MRVGRPRRDSERTETPGDAVSRGSDHQNGALRHTIDKRRGLMSRRDALLFIGGGTAGTMLTPLPWKLLDDVAIWTQNGSHIMHVPRGATTTRTTHCTLCPVGCGLRVRCSGGRPVGIAGLPGHPRSFGATCPLGLAAHHLSFHPHRATAALWRAAPEAPARRLSIADAVAELGQWVDRAAQRGTPGAVAILDARPERSVSCLYRRWLAALGCGVYALPPGSDSTGLDGMLHERMGPFGFDLGGVRTVLSFGAPLLEGWTAPGRLQSLQQHGQDPFTLIQVESRPSTTALQAERWLAPRPGSEAALALGMAHVLLAEGLQSQSALECADDLEDYQEFVRGFTPERVELLTGIAADEIRATARQFASNAPAVAVCGVDPGAGALSYNTSIAVWGLDFLVGSVARDGGFVARRPVPAPQGIDAAPEFGAQSLSDLPDGSVRVLIVDGDTAATVLPWPLVQRKLAADGRVACLSAFDAGLARQAHLLLPTAAPFEGWDEAPAAPNAAVASYAVSAPMRQPRVAVLDPVTLVLQLAARSTPGALPAPESLDTEALIDQRAAAIAASGRGVVFESTQGTTTPVAAMTASDCTTALRQGGCWLDEAAPQPMLPRVSLLGRDAERRAALLHGEWQQPPASTLPAAQSLVLMPFANTCAGLGVLPPVLAKVYRESELLAACGTAFVHPSTAQACGVEENAWGSIETRRGRIILRIRLDAAVLPGVVHVPIGADGWAFGDGKSRSHEILDVCEVAADGSWRTTPATLQRA